MLDRLKQSDWTPNWLRKKGRKLTKCSRQLLKTFEGKAGDQELCQEMGIQLDELSKLVMQLRGLSIDSFYDASKNYDESETDEETIIYYYPDSVSDRPYHAFGKKQLKKILAEALDGLPGSERLVVSLHYLEELTTKEIGGLLRHSQSRVLQLHTKAMLRFAPV